MQDCIYNPDIINDTIHYIDWKLTIVIVIIKIKNSIINYVTISPLFNYNINNNSGTKYSYKHSIII